jgi:hypothetical protein
MTASVKPSKKFFFGVGCFNFRYLRPIPFELRVKEYVQSLKEELEKLRNLNDLEIEYDERDADEGFIISENPPMLEEGVAFPSPQTIIIMFRLYIPKRVQEELIGREPRTQTENFKVTVWHWYFGPVAFVESYDAGEDCDPSSAVQVVREFMEREVEKLKGPISFESLGPSPFHMDFYARHVPTQSEDILTEETRQHGYDRLDITFRDETDIERAVYFELVSELDVYYELIRHNRLRRNEWNELGQKWYGLREKTQADVPVYDIPKRLDIHRAARSLIADAFTFTVEDQFAAMARQQILRDEYGKDLEARFKRFVNDAANQEAYPVQSIIDWAKHVYEASFKTAEILTLVVAATVGGIVGALITSTLSR